VQQGLAGDAANIEAGSAEVFIFFNKGGLESQLGGTNRGYITPGAGADDQAIE
jgi:hypothetical protein